MAFKINNNHWEVIVDFMEKHPNVARGSFSGPTGKQDLKKLWQQLTNTLNALSMGERSTEKWQKTWCDLKYTIKKRASQINKDQKGTGGGPSSARELTAFELRILDVLGNTFHQGVGSREYGVVVTDDLLEQCDMSIDDALLNSEAQNKKVDTTNKQNEEIHVDSPEVVDHNYTPRKRKKTTQENEYEILVESLKEIKEIKINLNNLSNTLMDIRDILKEFLGRQTFLTTHNP